MRGAGRAELVEEFVKSLPATPLNEKARLIAGLFRLNDGGEGGILQTRICVTLSD